MIPIGQPLAPQFHPGDPDGQGLTTAATTQAPVQEQEGEQQVVLLEMTEQELAELRERDPALVAQLEVAQREALARNPDLAQAMAQEEPGANRWAFSPAASASARATGTSLLLMLVPIVKNATGSYALAYGGAAFAGQSVGAVLSKILPKGSQEYTVAAEDAGRLRQAKLFISLGAYMASLSAGKELPKFMSGGPLIGTALTISLFVGQLIQHGPFKWQQFMGREVSARDLTRPGTVATAVNLGMAAIIGTGAGGMVDGSNAIMAAAPNSTFDGEAGVAFSYGTLFTAVATFTTAMTYLPPLLQKLLSPKPAAPAENNAPADPSVNNQNVDGAADGEDLEAAPGGVQPPADLPPAHAETQQGGTRESDSAGQRRGDLSIV